MKRVIVLVNKLSARILTRMRKNSRFLASPKITVRNRRVISLGVLGLFLGIGLVYFFLLKGNGAAAAWWNDGWKYRKTITVSNSTTALSDYQIKITLDTDALVSAGKMQNDCDDVRIVGENGQSYDFWIEPNTCNTTSTIVWTKLTELPATGGDIYFYYGNEMATSVSKSPSAIFLQELDNVLGAWLLDESAANSCTGSINDSCDSSGNGYDGAWNGSATTTTTSKVERAVTFNGTDGTNITFDMVPSVTQDGSHAGYDRYTVTGYFKTTDTQGYIFDSRAYGGVYNNNGVALLTDGANTLWVYQNVNGGGAIKDFHYSVTSTDNNWHHFAVVRDGDNSLKLYIDGNEISPSVTDSNDDTTGYDTYFDDLRIANRYASTSVYPFSGQVDEFRIFSDALTESEIDAEYGDGTNRHGYVTANYSGKELIRQYSSNVSVGSPGTEQVGPGPIGYWKLDEGNGTSVNDSSGSNHTGNLGTGSSAPTWKSSEYCVNGSCLQFDGSDDAVNFGDTLDFSGNTEMTVSAWIKLTSAPSSQGQIISKYDAGTAGQWYFGVDGNRKVTFLRECGSYGTTGNSVLDLSVWNHVSGVYDGTNLKIYVNGILDQTAADSCSISNTSVDLVIGAGDNGSGTENNFPGFIDEVKVYPYARTADEIKQDYLFSSAQGSSAVLGASDTTTLTNKLVGYWNMEGIGTTGNGQTVVDQSGNGNDGTTAGGDISCLNQGKYGTSCGFDGTDDYIDVGTGTSYDTTGELSVSLWIKPTTTGAGGTDFVFSSNADASNQDFVIDIHRTAQRLSAVWGDAVILTSNSNLSANTWYHVVFVRSGSAGSWHAEFFVNGVSDGSTTTSVNPDGGTAGTRIGGLYAVSSSTMTGYLDEIRLYERALSQSEVMSLYRWAPGPVGYWKLDENAGTTIYDSSGNGNNSSSWAGNTQWVPGKYGSATYHDGNGDLITIPSSSTLDYQPSYTWSFWINPTTGAYEIIDKSVNTNNGWVLGVNQSKYQLTINYTGTDLSCNVPASTMTAGSWQYITWTWDGTGTCSGVKFYNNGALVGFESTQASSGTREDDSGKDILIGGNSYTDFPGKLDDIKFYNYVRTSSQIIEDMNGGHPLGGSPIGSQLTYWRMDEGYGDYAYDSRGNSDVWLGGGDSCPGSATCPTWTNDGKFGKALSFDGGDYMEAPVIAGYDNNGTNPYTATVWFKSNTKPTNNYAVMGIISNLGSSQDRFIQVTSAGLARFYVYSGSENYATGTTDVVDNTWHHLAGVFDGSTIYMYVDGKLEDSTSASGSEDHTNPYVRFSMSVGGYYDQTVGSIDEAKIYTTALTQDQVLLDMNQGKSMVLGSTSTGVGGTSPSNSAGRTYCVPGDTTTCSAPIFEMNLDENTGTTAYDTSTNGNNGSVENGARWRQSSQCKSTSCLEFDGADDYVGVSDDTVLNFGGGSFTAEAWVKFKSIPSVVNRNFILLNKSTDAGDSSSRGWQFRISKYTDKFSFRVWPSTGQPDVGEVESDDTISADTWYHMVGVYDGAANTSTLYINGILQQDSATGVTATDYATDLTIGAYTGGAGTHELDGYMDQVKIYDYARTPAQIAWDMNRGAPIVQYRFDECQGTTAYDSTGNGNNGTITIGGSGTSNVGTCNTSSTAWGNGASGKWNSSLNFDGSDDYAAVPYDAAFDQSSNFSISFWFSPTETYNAATSLSNAAIVSRSNRVSDYSSESDWAFFLFSGVGQPADDDDGRMRFGTYGGNIQTQTATWSAGQWYHITLVYETSTNVRIYVNGKLDNYSNDYDAGSINGTLDNSLEFARAYYDDSVAAGYYKGKIDDFRMYSYPLTTAQIKQIYSGGAVVFK